MRFGFNLWVGGGLVFAVIALIAIGIYPDAVIAVVVFLLFALVASLVAGADAKKAEAKRQEPPSAFPLLLPLQVNTVSGVVPDNWVSDHPVALAVFVVVIAAGITLFVVMRKRAREDRTKVTIPPARVGKSASQRGPGEPDRK